MKYICFIFTIISSFSLAMGQEACEPACAPVIVEEACAPICADGCFTQQSIVAERPALRIRERFAARRSVNKEVTIQRPSIIRSRRVTIQ